MQKIVFVLPALALAGCASVPPDPSAACYAGIPGNPAFAAIASKIPLADARAATLEMLSDSTRPNEDQKRAISLWAAARGECAALGKDWRAHHFPPGAATAFDQWQLLVNQSIAALYAGGTFGQLNAERQRLGLQMQANYETAAYNEHMRRAALFAPVNCTSVRTGAYTSTNCL